MNDNLKVLLVDDMLTQRHIPSKAILKTLTQIKSEYPKTEVIMLTAISQQMAE